MTTNPEPNPDMLIQSQQVTLTGTEPQLRHALWLLMIDAKRMGHTVTITPTSVTDATVGVTRDSQQNPRHTRGPWKVGKPDADFCGSRDFPHMVVLDYGVGPCEPNVMACRMSEVNAQLVSAAPEMYEALKAHLVYCETGSEADFNRFAYMRDRSLRKAAPPDAQGSVTRQSQQKSRQDGEA